MTEVKASAPRKGKAAAASTAPEVEAAVLPPADGQEASPVAEEAAEAPLPADEPIVPLGAGVSPELFRQLRLSI